MQKLFAACISVLPFLLASNGEAAQPTITRNAAGLPLIAVGLDGATSRFVYDAQNRLTELTDPAGRQMRFTYEVNSTQPKRIVGPGANGPVRDFTYDAKGQVTRVVADGQLVAEFTYDLQGRPLERHVRGRSIKFAYDSSRRLVSETDGLGRTWRYGYDAQGRLVQVTNPDGGIDRATYDADGNVADITDPAGVHDFPLERMLPWAARPGEPFPNPNPTFDVLGRLTASVDPSGARTQWRYDDQSRLVGMTLPGGAKLSWTYDNAGRVATTADSAGRSVSYVYDSSDRLSQVSGPSGDRANYVFDAAGRLTSISRPNHSDVGLSYDSNDHLTQVRLPGGGVARSTYDKAGRLTALRDASEHEIKFTYNAQGLLASRQQMNGRAARYSYDAQNRLAAIDDPVWPLRFAYDAKNRVTEEVFGAAGNAKLSFTTNADGRRQSVSTPAGRLGYSYEAHGLVSALDTPAGRITFAYNNAGRIASLKLPNGISGTWHYAPDGGLASLRWSDAGGHSLAGWTLSRDTNGLTSSIAADDGARRAFAYDNEGRLTSELGTTGTNRYSYGPGGDMTSIQRSSQMMTLRYDNKGRVIDAGGPVAYDRDDRITASGGWSYSWDAESQLTAAVSGPTNVHFGYDTFGNLVRREQNGAVRRYLYDGNLPLAVVDRSGQAIALNVFGPGCSAPLLTIWGGQALFLPCDPYGGTALIVNPRGQVAERIETDAFGRLIEPASSVADLFLLHGMAYDGTLGLYRTGARWYDPLTTRFLTPDPRVPELSDVQAQNTYAFARNAPTVFADPTGTRPTIWNWQINIPLESRRTGISPADIRSLLRFALTLYNDPKTSSLAGNAPAVARAATAAVKRQMDFIGLGISLGTQQPGPDALQAVKLNMGYKAPPTPTLAVARPDAAGAPARPGTLIVNAPGALNPPAAAPAGAAAASGIPISQLNAAADGEVVALSGARPALPNAAAPSAPITPSPPVAPVGDAVNSALTGANEVPVLDFSGGINAVRIPNAAVTPGNIQAPPAASGANAGGTAPPGASGSANAPSANEPGKGPSVRDAAVVLGMAALMNGATDAANCAARGGDAKTCLQTFGTTTGTNLVVGGIGAAVMQGLTNLASATMNRFASAAVASAAGTVGAAAAGAVAVGATAYSGIKLGNALANLRNSQKYGTTEQEAASRAGVDSLDPRIAELADIDKQAAGLLAKPLADVQQFRAALSALRASTAPAGGPAGACALAARILPALESEADDAEAAGNHAADLMRTTDDLGASANATNSAAAAAQQALQKVDIASHTILLAAQALADVRNGVKNEADLQHGKNNVSAFSDAIDELRRALANANGARDRWQQILNQLKADAQAMEGLVTMTYKPALDRRVGLINQAKFEAQAQLNEARALIDSAPAEINTAVDALKRQEAGLTGAKASNPCAPYAGDPPGWRTAATKAADSARVLQRAFDALTGAIKGRLQRLAIVENTNNTILATGPQKLAQANSANDKGGAANIQAIIDRAKARANQVLQPQHAALDKATAGQAKSGAALNDAVIAISAIR